MRKNLGQFFQKSWWVVLFCLCTFVLYFHTYHRKKVLLAQLSLRIEESLKEKEAMLQEKEELLLQVASQDDPAWIEMILMRDLGVVPEGFLKVHFSR